MTQKGQAQVLILAGIVILLALTGGIFFLGRVTAPKSEAPVATPQPTPTPDETVYTEQSRSANWKTYTNSKYRFSLKYPPFLSQDCCDTEEPLKGNNALLILVDWSVSIPATDYVHEIFIGLDPNTTRKSFEEYLKEERTFLPVGQGCSGEKNWTEETIKMDGINATLFRNICDGTKDRVYLPFPNGQNILSITKIEAKEDSRLDDAFNQILSTFKFLP